MSKDCWEPKYGDYKKIEKAGKAIDGDKDDVVLFLLTEKNKKENAKMKVQFMDDIERALRG